MKSKILSVLLIVCMALSAFIGLTSCDDEQTPATPQKLSAPVVTLTENVASWEADSNADKFEISLDGTLSYVENTITSKTLTNGQSLKVRAVGDGISYSTSDWSNSVTFTEGSPVPQPTKLGTPAVTVSSTGLASWTAVANASSYVYKINGGTEISTTATSVQLADGQSIAVKAVGDGTSYTDGDYSPAQTYTAGAPVPQPTKLGTPAVTVSSTGLASWAVVANASSYVYKINGGAEIPTTATSVQLADGQSIAVRAIGDGINYTSGDYSAAKTYTAGTPTPTEAPTYLGIMASTEEPTSNDAPSGFAFLCLGAYSTRVPLDEALRNYLTDSNNSLGDAAPTESSYEVYSSVGNTVYIQIWLDNPDQNTILSLKLNGMKYQSGGALQSFFIENGASYLNCVYVAITIPAGSYNEIAYEVTEIEYVEGANINQDGKAVLIDEDNDTVLIGLPYEQAMPTATVSNPASTATSISFDVTVTDEDGFVNLVDGWLRVVLYNQNNEILAQQKLTNGNNTVTFNDLSADTNYSVMAFVLGDIHDGNGVYVHSLNEQTYKTENVITATITSDVLRNEQTGKYYPVINVTAELGDASFSFTKVEVCDWGGEVYYTGAFDGSISITENILNNNSYLVKIYYENVNGAEQCYQPYDSVYVERLDYPWILEPCLQYGLIDDAVLGFDFGTNKSNFDNLTIRIIDEYSKRYLAADAIYLINNQNAVEELEDQWQSMDWSDPNFNSVYDRWYKLGQARDRINEYYPDVEITEWEIELAKGIYIYEYVYGQDDEFFRVGNKFYVVLDGYQSQKVNDYSWKYLLTADFDLNDGEGVEEGRTILDKFFNIKPSLSQSDYLFAESFTLGDGNVVYLETMSRNTLGDESYRKLGYVNQIVLAKGNEILQVLWTQDAPDHTIDEAAWMDNIINALKAGEDVHSVFPLGELQPITFDLDDIQFNPDLVGNYYIRFTFIMFGKEYTSEHPYDWDGTVIDYTLEGALPKVTVGFTDNAEEFGRWSITSPDWVKNGIWNFSYSIEIRDADQNLVDESYYSQYEERLPINYSIRVRLDSYSGEDYYTQGEWSDWFTCLPITLPTPTGFTQSYEVDCTKVMWNGVDGVEKFVYILNGGEEQELTVNALSGLKNGDKIKVKAVPAAGSNYAESEYSEVYTVTDTRTQLATPTNIRVEYKLLLWNAVENATRYEIEFLQNGSPYIVESDYPEFYNVTIGKTYRIRACSEDTENYLASEWSEGFTYTVTLENPTFNEIRRERVYWNRVENAGGYNYKIGENGTATSTGYTYVALSEIPVGEKLYVQAYAEGCESTEWVMIYHNVTKLATPQVTVSGGTASWSAIENAKGYLYKINGGEETPTTELSVSGLNAGDTVTVCATTDEVGYANSDWSEIKAQLPTMSAPVLDTSLLSSEGTVSWGAVDGATSYEYDLEGNISAIGEMSVSGIQYGQSFKVRAVCDNGEYELYGDWCEVVVREDTREQLATPVIAYEPEIGLTVAINDPNVSYYEVIFGQDGLTMQYYPPDGAYETEVITNSFAFPENDHTVYVKAVSDSGNYRDSEWATLTITFE